MKENHQVPSTTPWEEGPLLTVVFWEGFFNKTPRVDQFYAPLLPENVDADWEDYWLGKFDTLQGDCLVEFERLGDVVQVLDKRIDGQQVALGEIQQKFEEECSNVDSQFVSKEAQFDQLMQKCVVAFNGHNLQIATLIQDVASLAKTVKSQGVVVPVNSGDQTPPLFCRLRRKCLSWGRQ